jgi:hypothetical protein
LCAARLPVYTACRGNIKLARLFVPSRLTPRWQHAPDIYLSSPLGGGGYITAAVPIRNSVASSMYLGAPSGLRSGPYILEFMWQAFSRVCKREFDLLRRARRRPHFTAGTPPCRMISSNERLPCIQVKCIHARAR